jgi:hypothetical protein
MIRKILVDYLRDIADITKDHYDQMHTKKIHASPSIKIKRTNGMTDYTKAFLQAADKARNTSNDDDEGPGLTMIPEDLDEQDIKDMNKIIQDEDLMKRIVRYNLLSHDEQKSVDK